MRIAGIVLAGGQSRRMRRDKATLRLGATTLLERVVAALAPVASPIVVVRAADQALPALPRDVIATTDRSPGLGPLEGLRAGLAAIHGRADAAFVAAVDLPFLSSAFVRRVAELLAAHEAAVPRTRDGIHPLAACYRAGLEPLIEPLLAEKRLAMHELLARIDCRFVDAAELEAADPGLRSLVNVNTPEDFVRAEAERIDVRPPERR